MTAVLSKHRQRRSHSHAACLKSTQTGSPLRFAALVSTAIFLLVCLSEVQAQHYITGKVVDAADGTPLALSHILVEETGAGSTANREGRFMVRVPELPAGPDFTFETRARLDGFWPVAGTDVVCWYTFGVTHFVRPEDWPVMPVEYCGFVLSPAGFFDRNPALDVPRSH
jgi:hypothetical protein